MAVNVPTKSFSIYEPSGADGKAALSAILDLKTRVSQNIRAILGTEPGQRVMRQVGLPLSWLLYEPADEVTTIMARAAILQVLTTFEPRATFGSVNVTITQDNNSIVLNISIFATLKETSEALIVTESITLRR